MSLLTWLGVGSGLVLGLTGIGMLAAHPRREGSRFFALFTIVWGLDIVIFNSLEFVDDPGLTRMLLGTGLALSLIESLFLIHFIVRFTDAQRTRHVWWTYGAAIFVGVVGATLALRPSIFLGDTGFTGATSVLVFTPNFAAFYIALHVLVDRYLSMRMETAQRESAIVAIALALYASYTAGYFLTFFGLEWLRLDAPDPATEGPFLVLFAAATLLLAVSASRTFSRGGSGWTKSVDRWIGVSLLAPFLLGVATGAPSRLTETRVDLFGVLRIAAGVMIAYGVLKYDIFEIDLKIKNGLRRSTIAGIFLAVFFLVSEGTELFVSGLAGTWAGLAAAGLMTLALRPLETGAKQVADRLMPGVEDSEQYRDRRSLEVYRAAVERAAGDQVLTEREREILNGLRGELGIDDDEARSIEDGLLPEPLAA